MLSPHEARYALDCLLEGGMDHAEREQLGRKLGNYIDHVGSENETLAVAHRHERDRHFANASQKEMELRTLRSVAELEALLSDSKVK